MISINQDFNWYCFPVYYCTLYMCHRVLTAIADQSMLSARWVSRHPVDGGLLKQSFLLCCLINCYFEQALYSTFWMPSFEILAKSQYKSTLFLVMVCWIAKHVHGDLLCWVLIPQWRCGSLMGTVTLNQGLPSEFKPLLGTLCRVLG